MNERKLTVLHHSDAMGLFPLADTAYIKSRGAWNELNDSKIGKISEAQVAGAGTSAYTLWYSLRS
jgi:ubiquitin C-terminal hydrolase